MLCWALAQILSSLINCSAMGFAVCLSNIHWLHDFVCIWLHFSFPQFERVVVALPGIFSCDAMAVYTGNFHSTTVHTDAAVHLHDSKIIAAESFSSYHVGRVTITSTGQPVGLRMSHL